MSGVYRTLLDGSPGIRISTGGQTWEVPETAYAGEATVEEQADAINAAFDAAGVPVQFMAEAEGGFVVVKKREGVERGS